MGDDRLKTWIGITAIATGVALPMLALLPLGWLWLWERGLVLWWLVGALVVSFAVLGIRLWTFKRIEAALARRAEAGAERKKAKAADAPAENAISPRERLARLAVDRLAAEVDPAMLTSREAMTDLGVRTVEAVAREMHPEIENPVWNFTLPEALTLVERVAQRLRPLIADSVPLGDRLTVAQAMAIYEWRGVIDWGMRAYDAWRIVRMLNPISAATQEIREQISKKMYEGLRQEVGKRIATLYVREVGDAAIDLYSGRLRVLGPAPAVQAGETAPEADTTPLRLLVGGRIGAGKSSLINVLSAEVKAPADPLPQAGGFVVYDIQRDGASPVSLIESPGLSVAEDAAAIAAKAAEADLLVWLVAADRPDRDLDRRALDGIRAWFRDRPDRRLPPMLVVASHVDRLRPFQEWQPPYDIAEPTTAKARTIRAALEAVAEDLAVPLDEIVPVCLASERGIYNGDVVWARVLALLPSAKGARLLRRIAEDRTTVDWRRILGQAAGAGRLAVDVVLGARGGKGGDGKGGGGPDRGKDKRDGGGTDQT